MCVLLSMSWLGLVWIPAALTCPGQTSLPKSCPVCAHTPLTADDCKPNKALRLTVKAFLKSEEKKRDKDRVDAASLQDKTSSVASDRATLSFTPSAQATLLQAAVPKVNALAETSREVTADRGSPYTQGDLDEHASSGHATSLHKVRKRNSQDIPHLSVEVSVLPAYPRRCTDRFSRTQATMVVAEEPKMHQRPSQKIRRL